MQRNTSNTKRGPGRRHLTGKLVANPYTGRMENVIAGGYPGAKLARKAIAGTLTKRWS